MTTHQTGYRILNPPPKPTAGSWWLCPKDEFYARADTHKTRMRDSPGARWVDGVHIRRMEQCKDS